MCLSLLLLPVLAQACALDRDRGLQSNENSGLADGADACAQYMQDTTEGDIVDQFMREVAIVDETLPHPFNYKAEINILGKTIQEEGIARLEILDRLFDPLIFVEWAQDLPNGKITIKDNYNGNDLTYTLEDEDADKDIDRITIQTPSHTFYFTEFFTDSTQRIVQVESINKDSLGINGSVSLTNCTLVETYNIAGDQCFSETSLLNDGAPDKRAENVDVCLSTAGTSSTAF